jgi:hypothetical protein
MKYLYVVSQLTNIQNLQQVGLKYDQLIIYYFSGTGNARNASKWITNLAEKQGIKTRLINIDRFEKIEYPNLSTRTLIGFCSPTHP